MPYVCRCPRGHELVDDFGDGTTPPSCSFFCPACGVPVEVQRTEPLPEVPQRGVPTIATAAGSELAALSPEAGATVESISPSALLARQEAHGGAGPAVPGYELIKELGRGGMGVVYQALHLQLRRTVALKMILAGSFASDRSVARFQAEARAVARLQHPNIVQIYEVGDIGGRPFFSLEYVDGGNLAEKLHHEPITPSASAALLEVVARAVHFAHEHGIVHRDLKPGNILLGRDGAPKITDFGLAKEIGGTVRQTESNTILGTPGYMAPEQAMGGSKSVGPGADTYAVGAILYECLTGRPPFEGDSPFDVVLRVASEDPLPPSQFRKRLPRDLETICLKCLEKEPRRRYASSLALAEDLRRFLDHEPIQARAIRPRERLVRWLRRRPVLTTVMVAVVLLTTVVAGTLGHQHRAEKARLEQSREAVRDLLVRGREAINSKAWGSARELSQTAVDRAGNERGLQDLHAEATEMFRRADGRLRAIERHQKFLRLHDDALFHAALAAGDAAGNGLAASRTAALRALDVAKEEAGGDGTGELFEPNEHQDLVHGRYELLLVLADAAAQPLAKQSEAERRRATGAALALLQEASKLRSQTQTYYLRKARFLEQLGETEQAKQARQQAAACPPGTAFEHYLVGVERYHVGPQEALPSFLAAVRLDPGHFWARYFLGLCYVRLRKPDLARDNLTPCLTGDRPIVWVYLLRGFALGQLGELRPAEDDFSQALKLLDKEPNREAAYALYNNRAVLRIGRKLYETAIDDLKKAIELRPEQYQAYASLAQAHLQQGNRGAAAAAYEKAIQAAQRLVESGQLEPPTLAVLYRNRARLHKKSGDLPAAAADLRRSVEQETADGPSRGLAWAEYADVLAQQKRLADAVAAYDASLKSRPGHAETQRRRAELFFQLGRNAEAEDGLTAYLKNNGSPTARIHRLRATARSRQGNHRGALDDLNLALERERGDAKLWLQRGQAYLACQACDLAIQDFDKALQLNDHLGSAYVGRGHARIQLGQSAAATADAEHAVRVDPLTPRVLQEAAGVFARAAAASEADRASQLWYRSRAVELLRQAIARVPAEDRATFWQDSIQRDTALRPLRATDDYAQWERQYGARRP